MNDFFNYLKSYLKSFLPKTTVQILDNNKYLVIQHGYTLLYTIGTLRKNNATESGYILSNFDDNTHYGFELNCNSKIYELVDDFSYNHLYDLIKTQYFYKYPNIINTNINNHIYIIKTNNKIYMCEYNSIINIFINDVIYKTHNIQNIFLKNEYVLELCKINNNN